MFLFNQHVSNQHLKVLVFAAMFFLIVGCGSEASASAQTLPPCETVSAQLYTGNFYPELQSMEALEMADQIYALAPQNLVLARRQALKFLRYETQRWSDVQSVPSQPNIRVIVSFISPGLVRAIVLNHLLYKYDPVQPPNLEVATTESLTYFDKKGELAFLILIQVKDLKGDNNFSIFPTDILLHTTADTQVKSTHHDDYVNLPLDFSAQRYSGLFFYPARVIDKGVCGALLKPGTETSLMLMNNKAQISNNQASLALHWQISLPMLININKSLVDISDAAQSEDDMFENPLLKEDKLSIWDPNKDTDTWRDVGRLIWRKMIMDGLPE
jgi:hypothetical protein